MYIGIGICLHGGHHGCHGWLTYYGGTRDTSVCLQLVYNVCVCVCVTVLQATLRPNGSLMNLQL
jgi:hypothetical protein